MQYKSLNESILSVTNPQPKLVKEDIQTPQRKAEGEKDIKNLTGTYKRRIKKAAWIPNPNVRSNASDDALERANDALTNLSNRTTKHETERRSTELYGHRGKIIKKKSTVKEEQEYIERLEFALESIAEELECSVEDLLEDLQTRGRYLQVDRKATHSERLADIKGRKERKSKKVYGMHGKELAPSAAAYFKKHPTASRLLHNPSTAGD